jgi:cell division septation protein DedD
VTDITHDADDGFHEIQLSGKQLVFLFMVTTAVSVVIFLCGVFVGRGVHTDRPTAASDAALTTPAPAQGQPQAPDLKAGPASQGSAAPPVTQQAATQPAATPTEPPSPPADDELTYRKRLESEGPPAEKLKPQGTTARTDGKPEVAKTEAARPETVTPSKALAASAAATARTPGPDASAAGSSARPGRWVVQLVALRDRSAASSIVQRLSGKGYPAFIVNPTASTPNQVFRVQVGRYDDRREAEQVKQRLEKEEKFIPWVSR